MSYKKFKDLAEKKEPGVQADSRHVIEIMDNRHKKEIVQGHTIAVVDIYGPTCGPCRQMAPGFAKLAAKYYKPGFCVLAKEDVTLELTPKITSVPTTHFFFDGRYVGDILGADLPAIENKLLELINGPPPSGKPQPFQGVKPM